ncbi:MAG: hypothetical protein ABFS39_10755 [Pseudomonadota bacterium]
MSRKRAFKSIKSKIRRTLLIQFGIMLLTGSYLAYSQSVLVENLVKDEFDQRGLNGEQIMQFRDDDQGRVLTVVIPMLALKDYRGRLPGGLRQPQGRGQRN